MDSSYVPIGSHESTTIGAAVYTLPITATAAWLIIQTFNQNVRLTLDGSQPTTTKGFQLRAGDPAVRIPIGTATTIRLREEASGAVVQTQFVR